MIKLTSDELNTLIHDYFVEENYPLSLEAFKKEMCETLKIDYKLIDLVYYGLKYVFIKQHGMRTGCCEMFSLSHVHRCAHAEFKEDDTKQAMATVTLQNDDAEAARAEDVLGKGAQAVVEEENGRVHKACDPDAKEQSKSDGKHSGQSGAAQERVTDVRKEENKLLFEKIKTIFKSSQKKAGDVSDKKPFEEVASAAQKTGETKSEAAGPVQAKALGIDFGAEAETRRFPAMEYDTIKLSEHLSRTSLGAWNAAKFLATASADGLLRVFKGRCVCSKDMKSAITALDFRGDVVACGSHKGDVVALSLESRKERWFNNFRAKVNVVKVAECGVVAGSDDGGVSVNGAVALCGLGKIFDIEVFGDRVAIASQSGAIRIGDTRAWGSGDGSFTDLVGHAAAVNSLVHSAGLLFSASSDATVKIWDVASAALRMTHAHDDEALLVRVVDRRIYSSSRDATVRVWDFEKQVGVFRHSAGVTAFDKKKALLATGTADGFVKVWDERFGEAMCYKAKGAVHAVALSDDERLVCVCSENDHPVVLDLRRV